MSQENDRLIHYLHHGTAQKLSNILVRELIENNIQPIVGWDRSGLLALLRDSRFHGTHASFIRSVFSLKSQTSVECLDYCLFPRKRLMRCAHN
jgi:hypothetical protein